MGRKSTNYSLLVTSLLPLIIGTFLVRPGWADDKERAKAKFIEGVELVEKENYPAALTAFIESYRIRRKASVLLNIGMCQKALYSYVKSIRTFKLYLKKVPPDKIDEERMKNVRDAIAEMSQLVGKLRVEDAPDSSEITVNGKKKATTPFREPLLMDPGKYTVEVKKDGYELLSTEVTIASGAETTLRAQLTEKSEEAPIPFEPKKEPEKSKINWLLYTGIATAVVGAGIAGGVGGYYTHKGKEDFDNGERASNNTNPEDEATYQDMKSNLPKDSAGAIAGYTVGGALLVTGVVLIILGTTKEEENDTALVRPTLNGLQVSF